VNDFDVADELLVPVVFAAANPIVQAAREVYGRPLPRLRSQEYLDAPRVVQQAVLVIGGESLVLGDPMRVLLREVSNDVHGGSGAFWRRVADNHIPHDELQRRRSQPGPMAGGTAA
jgi:hypothetical protein